MKAAVVTKDHHVDVTDKTLRSLKHGEALLKMECCGVCDYQIVILRVAILVTQKPA